MQIEQVKTICPDWTPGIPPPNCPSASASDVCERSDDELDEEFDLKGESGGSAGGGGMSMAPSVSTFMTEGGSGSDGVTESGTADLWYLASQNHVQQIEAMLQAGTVDVNDQDTDGQTALHFAADRGHMPLLHLLLDAKACVNLQASDGQTALHYAAAADALSACQALLDAGADKGLVDEDGSAPSELTEDEALRSILRL